MLQTVRKDLLKEVERDMKNDKNIHLCVELITRKPCMPNTKVHTSLPSLISTFVIRPLVSIIT